MSNRRNEASKAGPDWSLERLANEYLRKDAEAQGYVVGRRASPSRGERGMVDYHRDHGITNADTEDLTHRHEAVGFTNEQLEYLAAQPVGERHSRPGPNREDKD